jgi:hypothetical protein
MYSWYREYLLDYVNTWKEMTSIEQKHDNIVIDDKTRDTFTSEFIFFVQLTGAKSVSTIHILEYGKYVLAKHNTLIDVLMVYHNSNLASLTPIIMDIVTYKRAQYIISVIERYLRLSEHGNITNTRTTTPMPSLSYEDLLFTEPNWIHTQDSCIPPDDLNKYLSYLHSIKIDTHLETHILNLLQDNKHVYDDVVNIYTCLKLHDARVSLDHKNNYNGDFVMLLKHKGLRCYDIWRHQNMKCQLLCQVTKIS